jgi:hypothetical protein
MRPSVARPNALIRWLVSTRVCHRDDACSDVRPFIGQRSSSVAESARPFFDCHPKRCRSGIGEIITSLQRVKRQQEKKKYRRRGDVVLASLLTSSSLAFKRVQAGAKRRASERAKRRSAGEWMEASTHPRIVGQGGTRTRVHTHAAARASIGTHGTACPQRVQRLLPPACAACRVACRWGCQDPPEGGFCGGVTLRYPP